MADMRLLRELRRAILALRDRLPLECLLCRSRAPGGLCVYCRDAVCASMAAENARCARCDLLLSASVCPDCGDISPSLSRVVAAFDYAWPGELLIQRLKQGGRYSSAPLLAKLLAERCVALKMVGEDSTIRASLDPRHAPQGSQPNMVVTAVPSSRKSLVQRGYNPAAEIGRALARRLNLEWQPGLLQRAEEGSQQKHLGRKARYEQVRGLYRCPLSVSGIRVLVVDDVMTTGSTLSAIADALMQQGTAEVCAAVVARTPAGPGPLPR